MADSGTLRVAATTLVARPVASFDEHLRHLRRLLDAADGADLVVLPEMCSLELFSLEPGWRDADVPAVAALARHASALREFALAEAAARGIHLLAGTHLVQTPAGLRNVAWLAGPEGLLLAHEKTHLFPMERAVGTGEGDEIAVARVGPAVVGIATCYEAEIPEYTTALAALGADVILCPSLTNTKAGFWRVRHCLHARAIENQVYAVHSCLGGPPIGPHTGGTGRGAVLAPCDAPWPARGVLAECPVGEGIAAAELDLGALHANRRDGAATTHVNRRRRAGLHARWADRTRDVADAR